MKQLIRYLIPLVIVGAVLLYLDVWSRSIAPIEDPALKDAPGAPRAAAVATTPGVKSGYQFPLAPPPTTPAGPFHFTTTGEPPKVSVLPQSTLYYGACGPQLLQVTFAPGAQNAAKHVQAIDVVLHFLDDQGVELAKSSSPMTPIGGGLDPSHPELSDFGVTLPDAILSGFDPGITSLPSKVPSKISFSFLLHFAGSPDQELWWKETASGDQVVVAFESGDINRPVVISVYPCPQEIPATPTPYKKSEKEPEGAPCSRRYCP